MDIKGWLLCYQFSSWIVGLPYSVQISRSRWPSPWVCWNGSATSTKSPSPRAPETRWNTMKHDGQTAWWSEVLEVRTPNKDLVTWSIFKVYTLSQGFHGVFKHFLCFASKLVVRPCSWSCSPRLQRHVEANPAWELKERSWSVFFCSGCFLHDVQWDMYRYVRFL